MKMIIQEFEMSEALRNSDGNIIRECEPNEFVAIYEETDNEHFSLEQYLNAMRNGHSTNKEVVILPKKDWNAIQAMIIRNYDIKPKNI